MENINIEPPDNYKAIKYGFLLIVLAIILRLIFDVDFSFNPLSAVNVALLGFYSITFFATWVLRFAIAIWVANIAKSLHRSSLFWGIFSFIFPPLGLIIIGFLDMKIGSRVLKEIINNCRADYIAEKIYVSKELDLPPDKLTDKLTELKKKHNDILQASLIDYYTDNNIKDIQNLNLEGIIDSNIDYNQQRQKIKESLQTNIALTDIPPSSNDLTYSENETENLNQCPACGFKIDPELIICPDCGLRLK